MWNDAAAYTIAGWHKHRDETGHDNSDSDDDYEIRCRVCNFAVTYNPDDQIKKLESRILAAKEWVDINMRDGYGPTEQSKELLEILSG